MKISNSSPPLKINVQRHKSNPKADTIITPFYFHLTFDTKPPSIKLLIEGGFVSNQYYEFSSTNFINICNFFNEPDAGKYLLTNTILLQPKYYTTNWLRFLLFSFFVIPCKQLYHIPTTIIICSSSPRCEGGGIVLQRERCIQ
jgi:hypothetical protein